MRLMITICLTMFAVLLSAQIEPPQTHIAIMLDAKFYHGDRANDGNYDYSDRFQVRKAEISFEGELERFEYAAALGMCTCSGNAAMVDIQEAEIMYNLHDSIKFGVRKGHVLRGFTSATECQGLLASEKPNHSMTFGTCHPMGVAVETYHELPSNMALETEVGLFNGGNSTLDDELDLNVAALFQTPLPGLSALAVYNLTNRKYFDASFNQYSENGYRWAAGLEYVANSLWVTSEFLRGKGFERDDQEMQVWYAQVGYDISTGLKCLPGIQPYVYYENWDKDVGNDAKYQFLEAGMNFKTSANSMLRLAYKSMIEKAPGGVAEPDQILARIQVSL
ncbi:MAG TPA: hypothetical protein GX398_05725 [Candidatus Cloacimonetes bacterium]|jgi:hypothetical protein|nr:hypothetical protein [Candidatus Cloacimonadota bacterium]